MHGSENLKNLLSKMRDDLDTTSRLLAFKELHGLLLCRSDSIGINDDSLQFVIERVIELQGDSSFKIRRIVAQLSTSLYFALKRVHKPSLQKIISCLMLFLEDSKPSVVRCVIGLNSTFQGMVAEHNRDLDVVKLVNNMRDRSVSKYDSCTDDGVRNRIVRLLQFLVVLYSSGINSRGLFITGQDLDILKHLSSLIGNRKSSATNICSVINALCSIARSRPQLVNACITPLLSLQRTRRPGWIEEVHWDRVLNSLKFALAFLSDFQPALRFRDPISAALRRIVSLLRASKQKRKTKSLQSKNGISGSIQVKQLETISGINPIHYDSLHRLSTDRAIQVSLSILEDFLIPEIAKANTMISDFQRESSNSSSVSDRKKMIFDSLPGLSRMSPIFESLTSNMFSMSVQDPRLRTKAKQAATQEIKIIKKLIDASLKEQRAEILRQLRRSFVPPLRVLPIDASESSFLQAICIKRVCFPKSIVSIQTSGALHVQESIISRMLSLFFANGKQGDVMSDLFKQELFISEGFASIMRFLYLVYTHEAEDDSSTLSGMYELCSINVFTTLKNVRSPLMRQFLIEIPSICHSLYDLIISMCTIGISSQMTIDQDSLASSEASTSEEVQGTNDTIHPYSEMEKETMQTGLDILCDIIILRPFDRSKALDQILDFCSSLDHTLCSVSQELVTDSLFPHTFLSKPIEDYSLSILRQVSSQSVVGDVPEFTLNTSISLFLSLCQTDPSLFHNVVDIFAVSSEDMKSSLICNSEALIKQLGMGSPVLLSMIRKISKNAEPLILRIINVISEGQIPSTDLVKSVLDRYQIQPDAMFLIPVLHGLKKQQILDALPNLIRLPSESVRLCMERIIKHAHDIFSPVELIVRLHTLAPYHNHGLVKNVSMALDFCFQESLVSDPAVLGAVLQQLIDLSPIPVLIMRTVEQILNHCASLTIFVVGLLPRLVNKKVWKIPEIWSGFLLCCIKTAPHSYSVLLNLPRKPFKKAVDQHPELVYPLYMCLESQAYIVSRDIRAIIYDEMYRLQQGSHTDKAHQSQ